MVDISTVGILLVPKEIGMETSRRGLSEDVSFGIGNLLAVDQIEPSKKKKTPLGKV